jgi:putative flavoprotein involved in K+ transport
MRDPQAIVAGGRSLSLQALARAGAILAGRLVALDLRAEEIGSVIWCTGFGGDFSYLDPALLDADGQPRRRDAAGAAPGLWYLGMRWLTRRSSGIFFGFPGDAAAVADAVRARL